MASQQWRQGLHTVQDRNRHIFTSKRFADVTLTIGESSKVFKAHKVVLATASSVFADIIRSSGNNAIVFSDVDPESFEIVLEYIYTDGINFEKIKDLTEIHSMAEKFDLPGIVTCAIKFMLSDLKPCNTLRYYEFAKYVENSALMGKCVEIIEAETIQVLTHEDFCCIKCETLFEICCMKKLNINSELDLFLAIGRFAIANDVYTTQEELDWDDLIQEADANGKLVRFICKAVQKVRFIRKAVQKVRFLTLTPKQFAEATAKSKLLQQNEKYALLVNISSGKDELCPMPKGFTNIKFGRISPEKFTVIY